MTIRLGLCVGSVYTLRRAVTAAKSASTGLVGTALPKMRMGDCGSAARLPEQRLRAGSKPISQAGVDRVQHAISSATTPRTAAISTTITAWRTAPPTAHRPPRRVRPLAATGLLLRKRVPERDLGSPQLLVDVVFSPTAPAPDLTLSFSPPNPKRSEHHAAWERGRNNHGRLERRQLVHWDVRLRRALLE